MLRRSPPGPDLLCSIGAREQCSERDFNEPSNGNWSCSMRALGRANVAYEWFCKGEPAAELLLRVDAPRFVPNMFGWLACKIFGTWHTKWLVIWAKWVGSFTWRKRKFHFCFFLQPPTLVFFPFKICFIFLRSLWVFCNWARHILVLLLLLFHFRFHKFFILFDNVLRLQHVFAICMRWVCEWVWCVCKIWNEQGPVSVCKGDTFLDTMFADWYSVAAKYLCCVIKATWF